MIRLITRRIYRHGLDALERGDLDALLARFDDRCTLTFVGDTPLGASLTGTADIRRWFERFVRLVPAPTFRVRYSLVNGPLWNQRLVAHFLRLRWGTVVDDVIIEDSQRWDRACQRLVAVGVTEAAAPPMSA
jgi:hypothetical protein